MPERNSDLELENILGYPEQPEPDEFVMQVMRGVQRQRRLRKLILSGFGLAGALFGAAGAAMLAESISSAFAGLPVMGTMQAVLLITGAFAFYTWFMNDDLTVTG